MLPLEADYCGLEMFYKPDQPMNRWKLKESIWIFRIMDWKFCQLAYSFSCLTNCDWEKFWVSGSELQVFFDFKAPFPHHMWELQIYHRAGPNMRFLELNIYINIKSTNLVEYVSNFLKSSIRTTDTLIQPVHTYYEWKVNITCQFPSNTIHNTQSIKLYRKLHHLLSKLFLTVV